MASLYKATDLWLKGAGSLPMERKRAIAAYCRVSTLEQKRRGFGIDIQIRDVTLFAERQGLFVDRFYKDALRRLLRDCRHGEIATVILPSLDRLSRNVRIAENLFFDFERRGVQVLIADMPTYDSRDRKDVMLRQIREVIAEENRKDIIERLWKGRQERVRRGLPPGGNAAYGFRRGGQGLIPDENEVSIVQEIFALAAQGIRAPAIAKSLNAKGLVRRNGKPWTQRQVNAVLIGRELYQEGAIRYGAIEGRSPGLILVRR